MTDFESEKFYHDLRQKLEGYGSAPPETVWAGIREQVPIRKRRRRPALLLLLAAMVVVSLTVGTKQWKPFFTSGSAPVATGELGTAGERTSRTTVPATGPRTGAGLGTAPPATTATTTATAPAATETAARGALSATTSPSLAAPAATSRSVGTLARAGTGPADRSRIGITPPEAAASKRRNRRLSASEATGTPDATASAAYAATSPAARPSRRKAALSSGLLASSAATRRAARLSTRNGSGEPAAYPAAARQAKGTFRSRTIASQPVVAGSEAAEAADLETSSVSTRRRGRLPKISNAPLALRTVRPAALSVEEPEVEHARRAPRKRLSKRELRLRNWSGQLLFGSGVTYRALGGAPTQLEQLERPSLGFNGQATATYALSRQLSVSAGLGYAEYATSLNYQLKKTASENLVETKFRDVYRFFTIPVQAQLTLGGNPRWRYGVLGGGALGILAGAQTTEGSACNCRQTNWATSTKESPFTRTNLLFTGGAFASYQFALGQWFTIRPQGQVFLNSLTTPTSGRAARRPWSLGLQAGYSWDLDPRKH
ncbi:outer membrane beta-barrel protein [Hymenobacter metallicola]|uniref:Outer membrane protein beta-barrel domain-containing protein n=1 Tax=Hymenobacter metallicola TaxID=2563114 RepID=A0A4Z0QKF6_9BACT|nr:outer membrane beta-barrel protein [Hymenobacter metallicola]TGE29202.1 hypothetical protein E5K02_07045 [Hymenobacter metallicola]